MYGEGPVPLAFRSDGHVSLLSSYAKTTCSVGESTEVTKVRIFASECLFFFVRVTGSTCNKLDNVWCVVNGRILARGACSSFGHRIPMFCSDVAPRI